MNSAQSVKYAGSVVKRIKKCYPTHVFNDHFWLFQALIFDKINALKVMDMGSISYFNSATLLLPIYR